MSEEKELIESRELLRRCMNCKNSLLCWHLTDNIPVGKNPRLMKIHQLSLLKHFLKPWSHKKLKDGWYLEYYMIRTMMNTINPALSVDTELSHKYTLQVLAVMEMIANSSGKNWCCPGEEEGNPETFKYDPIRDLNEVQTKLV